MIRKENVMDKTTFTPGEDGKTLVVERAFNAPVSIVWNYWTKAELLDQWWAPSPWKAVTKSMDFSEGGRWHYYMEGPEGERHYCLVDYKTIDPEKSFTALDGFCDEEANRNYELPTNDWHNQFIDKDGHTHLIVTLTFETPEDLQKIVEMGFKEGFTQGLDQLETLLTK